MTWQKILAQGFTSSKELLEFLDLPSEINVAAEKQFKTRVPRRFAERMRKGDPSDPLLLQVLAQAQEDQPADGYTYDPLNESTTNPIPGLIHKYQSRVLLTLTGACAVNCRYCFRRHFPYEKNNPGKVGWQQAIQYIQKDTRIKEVIFSGGDPLLTSDQVLNEVIQRITKLQHVTTLRFHTRIPVVLPERVDDAFLSILKSISLQKVMVLHINHPQEIDAELLRVCQALRAVGVHLLCQSVLLKGINDCPKILATLSEKLFACGILPYYLHVLDKVAGAWHFDLSTQTIALIYKELQALLPGYLVPKLVREESGESHKTLLSV